jgi:hypothetical protein
MFWGRGYIRAWFVHKSSGNGGKKSGYQSASNSFKRTDFSLILVFQGYTLGLR